MSRNLALITVAISLGFVSCDDSVRSEYATRPDAEADRLFERGWLPEIIPQSSRGIVTLNDLDLNTSTGEFRFDSDDLAGFVAHLARDASADSGGFRAYRYQDWSFQIDERGGLCLYDFRLQDAPRAATQPGKSE